MTDKLDDQGADTIPEGQTLRFIENRLMFLGSWAFWASGTSRHFQPFSENKKIRHFQAFSGKIRHLILHDLP